MYSLQTMRMNVYYNVLGTPILIGDVLTKPNNSLICQSRDATYHPGVVDKTNERNIVGKSALFIMYLVLKRNLCIQFSHLSSKHSSKWRWVWFSMVCGSYC